MEINGILTKMMWDHDRLRHSFYVEESYVIPWMYPYLSPHGLIMKLNADRTPYDPKTAAKDQIGSTRLNSSHLRSSRMPSSA